MSKQWTTLIQWFDQRTLRERAVLLLGAVAIMLAPVYLVILEPAAQQRTLDRRHIEQMTAEISQLEQLEKLIVTRSQLDPDQELNERHEQMVLQLADQRQQLQMGISHLVTPSEMPALLKQMLGQDELHLLSLENQQPELISAGGPSGDQAPRLYRHPVQMELRGEYLSLLSYLRGLEQLPRLLVWEDIGVETQEYPATTIRLRFYTMGLTEGWLR